jgi:predicted nucleic acid-binding protein
MPGKHRVSCEQTMLFIADIRERLSVIALDADEYADLLEKAAAMGVVGGAIFDAILAACALKSGAKTIYTWNVRHFGRFGPEITRRVRTP